jgi:hypothetical protein
MGLMRNVFRGYLISRFVNIRRHSRSPDLSPPDYFLWGCQKDRIFQTIQEPKIRIRQEIEEINRSPDSAVCGEQFS